MTEGILFETGHKPYSPCCPRTEHLVIIVGSIYYHHGFRLKNQRFGDCGFVSFAISDQRPAWEVFPVVELKTYIHHSFGAPELRPFLQGETQVNDHDVQTNQRVLELELPLPLSTPLSALD